MVQSVQRLEYGLDSRGSISGKGKEVFSLYSVQAGCGALSPGVNRQECEAENSNLLPRSRMVALYLHSPYALMVSCLITQLSREISLPSAVTDLQSKHMQYENRFYEICKKIFVSRRSCHSIVVGMEVVACVLRVSFIKTNFLPYCFIASGRGYRHEFAARRIKHFRAYRSIEAITGNETP